MKKIALRWLLGVGLVASDSVIYSSAAGERARIAENPTHAIQVSDSWTYQVFDANGAPVERIVIVAVRVEKTSVRLQNRVEGSLSKIADTVLDSNGRLVQDGNPLNRELVRFSPPRNVSAWPLTPGKEWRSYTHARTDDWTCELRDRYQVAGWEKINVPAGVFDTIKVTWAAEIDRGSRRDGSIFSGKETGTYWYLPEARMPARIEYENTLGIKFRRELVLYHLD